jgi:hypothetical protein
MLRKRLRKALTIIMAAALMLAPTVSAASADTTRTLDTSLTASPSDLYPDQKVTKVDLSVPSYDMTVSSDIVFALDISNCSKETTEALIDMLERLHESAQSENVDIKIGIVFFRGSSVRYLELSDLDEAYSGIKAQLDEMVSLGTAESIESSLEELAATKDADFINKGSNLHAGLQEAKQMLDEDTSVEAANKHMIAISDCITYMFNDDAGNVKSIYSSYGGSETDTDYSESNLFYQWASDYGIILTGNSYKYTRTQSWSDYFFDSIANKVGKDGGQYDIDYRELCSDLQEQYPDANYNYGNMRVIKKSMLDTLNEKYGYDKYKYLTVGNRMEHASSIERSLYESWDTWKDMLDSGYQCYMVNPGFGSSDGTFPYYYTEMLNRKAGHTSDVDFDKITNQIVNAIESGTISFTIADEFELADTQAEKPFELTLSDEKQSCTVDESDPHVWHYGEKDSSTGRYPYDLSYDSETGKVTLKINVPVENARRIGLHFSLRLIPSPNTVTTYSVTDGNAVIDYTNSIDGDSRAEFPLAYVTYHPPQKETVDLTANVVWNDGGSDTSQRPDSVEIQLYRNGVAYGDPVTVSADDGWTHVFTGLDEDYSWSVDEPEVPEGWTKTVEHSGNVWTITNTRKATPSVDPEDPSGNDPEKPAGGNGSVVKKPVVQTSVTRRNVSRYVPATGDSSEPILWTALLTAAVVGAAAVSRRRKRS